jgi:midasin
MQSQCQDPRGIWLLRERVVLLLGAAKILMSSCVTIEWLSESLSQCTPVKTNHIIQCLLACWFGCLQDSLLQGSAEPSNLNPSWALSGNPDLETLLASMGVSSSSALAAMAAAHTHMAAACSAAHRKSPGMREARSWAATATVLLQQGYCLADALHRGWTQAYVRGFAATAVLAAEAQAAFLQLCEQLQLQPSQDAVQHDVMLPAATAADTADVDMLDEQQQQQQQGVLALWPNQLLRPCQWPVWVGVSDLAAQSLMAAVARDAALPVWLLVQALATELATAAGSGHSSSSSTAGELAAARQLLQQLPAGQQVLLPLQLLTAATGGQQHRHSSSSGRLLQLLPELSVTAVTACLFRPSVAQQHSHSLRQQWLQQQLAQVAAAAAASGKCGRSVALSQLLQQLLPTISQQPWSRAVQQLLQQEQQQQPQLALLLPLLQQASCHAAVAAAAGAASAAAVAAGAASPYQESVWRSSRPAERARAEASHPAVDGLQPCLAAVAAFEGAALQLLLQQVSHSSSSGEAGQLAAQIHRLQVARSSVWDAVHGALHLHFSSSSSSSSQQDAAAAASAAVVVAAVQPEQLAWAWSKLVKAVDQLLTRHADVAAADSASRWQFLQQQMAAALQLDAAAPKPLMWRHAGHPQLPPNHLLLEAQHKAAALADALAVQGGSGFKVDACGQPAGLVAAGVDWQQLLQEAVQIVQQQLQQYRLEQQHINVNAADADGEGSAAGFNDVTAVLEGLELGTGAGAELRERLAAAAAAVLCCDAGLRRGLTQGLAMLSFLPHKQLLQQQQQPQQVGSTAACGRPVQAADSLAEVPDVLQQQVASLLQPLLIELLSAPQQQQHEAAGAAALVAALKQQQKAGAAASSSSSVQLLPAKAMVSVAARQMQVDLQQLVHTAGLEEECKLAAAALAWLLSAAAAKATTSSSSNGDSSQPQLVLPVLPKQQLQQLQGQLQQYLATSGPACCQRSAAALVPLQQLSWVISSMLDERQVLPQQQLLQQVLPGLLHDAWFSWQSGLWAGSGGLADPQQQGSGLSGSDASALFGFMRGLSIPVRVTGSPLCLHLASRTAAVLQICAAGAADGTSKAARLQQLSLAAQQLLQQQLQDGNSSSSCQQQVLGLQLAQLLLAHISSFSSSNDAAAVRQLVQQLLSWCNSNNSSSAAALAPDAVRLWLQQLADALSRSTLVAAAQPLLLPCAEAILLPSSSSSSSNTQQQQQWYQLLGSQGWAWLLLGCARLQLVTPPPGVDPAGRYGYKAAAVQAWISTQLEPSIQVHYMMQQLPGAPDESASLKELTQQHDGLTVRLQKLRSRCVPRPDPPQYLYLQQEVAAFSRGLADPQRLLTVGTALLQSCSADGSNTAAAGGVHAVREAEMWDGSAAAWAKRMQGIFPDYVDVLQPVHLALLEVRQGLALLVAGSQAAQQAAAAAAADGSSSSSGQLMALTAGLLSFPPPLAGITAGSPKHHSSSSSSNAAATVVPASLLADPRWQKLTGSAVQQGQQQQQQQARSAAAAEASAELADFGWQLCTVHAALLVAVQEQLAAGPAAAAVSGATLTAPGSSSACSSGSDGGSSLGGVDSMLQQVLSVWHAVRAYEAAAAEEAAQLYKHKTHSSTFLSEEVRPLLAA